MAWSHQAASHYLSQCRPISLLSYELMNMTHMQGTLVSPNISLISLMITWADALWPSDTYGQTHGMACHNWYMNSTLEKPFSSHFHFVIKIRSTKFHWWCTILDGSDEHKRRVTSLMKNLLSQRPGYIHDQVIKVKRVQLWRVWI